MFKKIAILILSSAALYSEPVEKSDMTHFLTTIEEIFESSYAPANWKRDLFEWSINGEVAKAQVKIESMECPSVKDFQNVIRDLFASTEDFHVGVNFYSTAYSFLPFSVKTIGDRTFVVDVESYLLDSFPLQIGDEILTFDHQPIQDVLSQLLLPNASGWNGKTNLAMADANLTSRTGGNGDQTPSGMVDITFLKPGGSEVKRARLEWAARSEEILDPNRLPKLPPRKYAALFPEFSNKRVLKKTPFKSTWDVGSRRGFLPLLGNVVWQANSFEDFHAYIYETPNKKRIGFVRIPHYIFWDLDDFEEIIAKFERETDAMVIDQTNNYGGSVFFCYGIASLLSSSPVSVPRDQFRLNQKVVSEAIEMQEEAEFYLEENMFDIDFGGITLSEKVCTDLIRYAEFIKSEWALGKKMTSEFSFFGIDAIEPHPRTNYSKPILMLINESAYSCADFLPAMMQDNKRVTLMGAKTAGAGGCVERYQFPNRFGIMDFSLTCSIGYRHSGDSIENIGVSPDVPYELTVEDIRSNYKPYTTAINRVVESLIP